MKPRLLFGSVFAMGIFMIWHGVTQWRQGTASAGWPEVSGTVTQSSLRQAKRKHSLSYTYEVGGETFAGRRKQFGQSFTKALEGFEGLKEGDGVPVRHHPDRPALCTLKTGAHPSVFFFLLGGAVFAAGGVIAFFKSL